MTNERKKCISELQTSATSVDALAGKLRREVRHAFKHGQPTALTKSFIRRWAALTIGELGSLLNTMETLDRSEMAERSKENVN